MPPRSKHLSHIKCQAHYQYARHLILDWEDRVGEGGCMRVARHVLIFRQREQYFHVISRIVDRRMVFEDQEKGMFYRMMRQLEAFSGVEVVSYSLMGNHFHMLVKVPPKPMTLGESEVKERMKHIYSVRRVEEIEAMLIEMKAMGREDLIEAFYERMRLRMFDLSEFFKALKQQFSVWYNSEHNRKGTLWEERFRSVLIEGSRAALMNVAAYIELNAVRAGICRDPKDYRWCSYTEAVAGGKSARRGIMDITRGPMGAQLWKEAHSMYRTNLFRKGYMEGEQGIGKRRGLTKSEYMHEMRRNGEMDLSEQFSIRMRYFSEGLVIGSIQFVENFYMERRKHLDEGRKTVGYMVEDGGLEQLYSYRNVK